MTELRELKPALHGRPRLVLLSGIESICKADEATTEVERDR